MHRVPTAKTAHFTAKTRIETRPPHGMSRSAAPAALIALLALAGCFQYSPKDCQVLCIPSGGCPGELECQVPPGQSVGLCAPHGTTCPVLDSGVGPMDSGATDAGTNDAEAGRSGPPSMLCHNGSCFTLPDAVRANLVLLLWPSNLPAVGSAVSMWPDQSGQGNDGYALNPAAAPTVIPDGVHLDQTQLGGGFVVRDDPSLNFAAGDFALVVVAGLSSSSTPLTIARKTDGARTNSRQIAIDWGRFTGDAALTGGLQGAIDDTTIVATHDIAQPSVTAYTLYRSADHAELHSNGALFGSTDLPAGISTTNAADVYIGVNGMFGSPADSIEAVIAIRGPIESTVLNQLELFLRDVFVTL